MRVRPFSELEPLLHRLDGRGYKAYREIRGAWKAATYTLVVARVQGDPFDTPSILHVQLPTQTHQIPPEWWKNRVRRMALGDYLLRVFKHRVEALPRVAGTGHSGEIRVAAGQAEILERAAFAIDEERMEVRFRVGLPADGRRILGHAAARMLTEYLPEVIPTLCWKHLDHEKLKEWILLTEDHAYLQQVLEERGLVAFIRDGSILPRESGVSVRPLKDAVPFKSPPSLRVTLPTLHHGTVTGMGIPAGVTIITGGGFHGKSTLLRAIELGVYPHIPGDGREWVVTLPSATVVLSEDGRSVTGVDLSPFIRDLPLGQDTRAFSTQNASGSTSLAAAIQESLEVGSRLLLMDEDRAATNFLIRDARMQQLVRKETITPYIDRVRELYRAQGVSTILVVGGSGDYLEVADRVILMENYRPLDATEEAHRIVQAYPTGRRTGQIEEPYHLTPRWILPGSFPQARKEKWQARGLRELVWNRERIDLWALQQLVESGQVLSIGTWLRRVRDHLTEKMYLSEALRTVEEEVEARGLYALAPLPEQVMPRLYEVAGALNRLRTLKAMPFH